MDRSNSPIRELVAPFEVMSLLEQYQNTHGSYQRQADAYRKLINQLQKQLSLKNNPNPSSNNRIQSPSKSSFSVKSKTPLKSPLNFQLSPAKRQQIFSSPSKVQGIRTKSPFSISKNPLIESHRKQQHDSIIQSSQEGVDKSSYSLKDNGISPSFSSIPVRQPVIIGPSPSSLGPVMLSSAVPSPLLESLLSQITSLDANLLNTNQSLVYRENQLSDLQLQMLHNLEHSSTLSQKVVSKDQQLRQAHLQRDLQKSRNTRVLISRKQMASLLEKQAKAWQQQALNKGNIVDEQNKQINRLNRKLEDQQAKHSKAMWELETSYISKMDEINNENNKIVKQLTKQLSEYKKQNLQFRITIDRQDNTIEHYKEQLNQKELILVEKSKTIQQLKQKMEKQRSQHAEQLGNVIRTSRRKSSSRQGSSRSIGDSFTAQPPILSGGSSFHGANNSAMLSKTLRPVKQEQHSSRAEQSLAMGDSGHFHSPLSPNPLSHDLASSHIVQDQQDIIPTRLAVHYEAIMTELRNSHNTQLDLLKNQIYQLEKKLAVKDKQIAEAVRLSLEKRFQGNDQPLGEAKAAKNVLQIMKQRYPIKMWR